VGTRGNEEDAPIAVAPRVGAEPLSSTPSCHSPRETSAALDRCRDRGGKHCGPRRFERGGPSFGRRLRDATRKRSSSEARHVILPAGLV